MERSPVHHQMLVARELGGAGLIGLHIASYLQQHGKNAEVWVPGHGPAEQAVKQLGLPVQQYSPAAALSGWKLRGALGNWLFGRRLRRRGAGLIHVHGPLYYGAFRRGLESSGLARVVHIQIEEREHVLRWALRSPPELIVTCARFLVDPVRRALPEGSSDSTRIVAVPNAVDTEKFTPGPKAPAKERVGAPSGRPLVLMLANLAPHKGQETVIRAATRLKERAVDATFWLAGSERDGKSAYTERLKALIQDAGVGDRLQLLGQRSDAAELLRAADFFLLPSTREGLPLSVLEAQASGVPVLAAPTAGVPEVVQDSQTGYLIPADDADGYADRIERLLAAPETYHRVAEQARAKTTREYNWQVFCEHIIGLYEELLEQPSRDQSDGGHLEDSAVVQC